MDLIRRIAKRGMVASGVAAGLLALRGRRGDVPVVMYHGISSLGVDAAELDAQFAFFARHFETRFFSELPLTTRSRRPPLVLTFDDGMRNNFTAAVPLLHKHGLKATFFIVAGIFDGLRYLWNHRLCYQLYSLPEWPTDAGAGPLPADPQGQRLASMRWRAARQRVEAVKRLPHHERIALCARIDTLCAEAGIGIADWFDTEFRLAPAELVRQRPACVEYGSHTISHPILTAGLDERTLAAELAGSRARLEAETGTTVDTFSFPNGCNDARVRAMVAANYRLACTTVAGIHRGGDTHRIPRVPAAPTRDEMVSSMLRG
jgi:peptidoglycan/xylan/chitin deacetylase (PgdA/CDA1 family)